MPWERVPQHELVWLQAKPQKRSPNNCCRRFGKPVRTFLRFAGAPRLNVGQEIVGFHPDLIASSEQNSLRSHRYAAEVTAAVPKRFANYHELRLAEPFAKVSA